MIRASNVVDLGGGRFRPQSSEFSDSPKDGAMSVFVEDWVLAANETLENLLGKFPGSRMSWLYASEYQDENQVVEAAPDDDFFPGHAAVRDRNGKRSARTRTRLAQASRWLDDN
jgi:hypothetical protein